MKPLSWKDLLDLATLRIEIKAEHLEGFKHSCTTCSVAQALQEQYPIHPTVEFKWFVTENVIYLKDTNTRALTPQIKWRTCPNLSISIRAYDATDKFPLGIYYAILNLKKIST